MSAENAEFWPACPLCAHRHLDYLDDEGCVSCGCPWQDMESALTALDRAIGVMRSAATALGGYRVNEQPHAQYASEVMAWTHAEIEVLSRVLKRLRGEAESDVA